MTKPKKSNNPAGRPPMMGETLKRFLLVTDSATIEKARKIGAGNISAGIRKAVARYRSS